MTSRDSDRDLEADGLLRAIAHSPPRRPRSAVPPGTPWGPAGRYVIKQRLGRGGMGTVYAATDTVLHRVVALKVLDAGDQDAAHHARLLREAQLAARVEHERIARVYDVGTHDGFAFVAMEYVAGGTLRQVMMRRDLSVAQIIDIATQIAEGLAELHESGVIHRDLKPENVMLTAQGCVKLLDFGLARNTVGFDEPGGGRGGTLDGGSIASASGTPGYMAPEQCAGQPIDARVDIFSLGVIVYELVTGERLFHGATPEAIMTATLEGTPVLQDGAWAGIPHRLRDHTARMLARDPEARFAGGTSVLAALRDLASELPTQRSGRDAGPPGSSALERSRLPEATVQALSRAATQSELPRPPHDSRALKHAARASAVVVAGLLMYSWIAPSHPRPPAPRGMVAIDVGAIEVGRNADEIERECIEIGASCARKHMDREIPSTRVTIPRFFVDQHEVTNEQFARMLNDFTNLVTVDPNLDDDDHYPRYVRVDRGTGDRNIVIDLYRETRGIEYDAHQRFRTRVGFEKFPVSKVSWYGAGLFCNSHGKRLPTEDEWEAAARGRTDRRFPWGSDLPRCGDVVIKNDGRIPMLGDCAGKDVAVRPVGSAVQDVTPEGIHDLGGNVSEWTASRFIAGRRASAPGGPNDAPRVIRGGSWASALMVRTTGRWEKDPSVMPENVGLRCASDAETRE